MTIFHKFIKQRQTIVTEQILSQVDTFGRVLSAAGVPFKVNRYDFVAQAWVQRNRLEGELKRLDLKVNRRLGPLKRFGLKLNNQLDPAISILPKSLAKPIQRTQAKARRLCGG